MIIGRQILVSLFSKIIGFILGVLGIKLLTNNLSSSNYGFYSLIFTTIGIISVFMDFGLHKYLATKIPGEEKSKGFSYFTSIFVFELSVFAIFLLLVISILPLNRYLNIKISNSIIILSALFLMTNILSLESIRFHSFRKRLELSTILSLVNEKFWIILMLIYILLFANINLKEVLSIRFVPVLFVLISSLYLMKLKKENLGENKVFEKNILVDGLSFGIPLIFLGFGHNLLINVDRYFIAFYYSSSFVGYYSLAYALLNIVYVFSSSIVGIAYFHFAESYNLRTKVEYHLEKSKTIFNCAFKLSIVFALFLSINLSVLKQEAILLFSTSEYLKATNTILLLSPFPILLTINFLSQLLLILEKQRKLLIKAYIIGFVLNVVLNILLIPKYGINGAAITTTISYLVITIIFVNSIKKYHIIAFTKRNMLKIFVSIISIVFILNVFRPDTIAKLIFICTLSAIIYVGILILLRVINSDDWNVLLGKQT